MTKKQIQMTKKKTGGQNDRQQVLKAEPTLVTGQQTEKTKPIVVKLDQGTTSTKDGKGK